MRREIKLNIPSDSIHLFNFDFSDGELCFYIEWDDHVEKDDQETDEVNALPDGPVDDLYDEDEKMDEVNDFIEQLAQEETTKVSREDVKPQQCSICGDPVSPRVMMPDDNNTVHQYCYHARYHNVTFDIDDVLAVIDGPRAGDIATVTQHYPTISGPDAYKLSNGNVEFGYVLIPPKKTPRPSRPSKKTIRRTH